MYINISTIVVLCSNAEIVFNLAILTCCGDTAFM